MLIHKHYCLFGLLSLLPALASGTARDTSEDNQPDTPTTDVPSSTPDTQASKQKLDPAFVTKKKLAAEKYEQFVKELESEGGVYEAQLSEILLGLGETYQSLELHREALDAFNRSLQISRVNSGLYSLNQISILEQMIRSNKALEDWEAVNKNYAYLYWVNKRNYGDFDPQLLPVIDRLGKWHLRAYTEAVDEHPFLHLLEADNLYSKAISIIELQHGNNAPQLLQALYGVALTNYQMATHVSNAEELSEINYGLRSSTNSRTQRVLQQELARQNLMFRSYAKGKKAMTRIVELHANNEKLPLDSHVLALTHLGDWYLLFNKPNSAAETYDEAYKLIGDGEETKKDIDDLFAQPRMLPTIKLPVEGKKPLEITKGSSYVVAMFNVSPRGKARNIEIMETKPENNISLKRKAKKSIAGSKFRPRFENGKPVETTGVKIRYIFDE